MGDIDVTSVVDLFGSSEIAMQADRAERVVKNVFSNDGSGDRMVSSHPSTMLTLLALY